jgi:TonB family protein
MTPTAGAQVDVDFGPYMADLQRRIKKQWFPPKNEESKRVVVVFKVHSAGEVSDLRIDHSSGSKLVDDAGLAAVKNASPLKLLPKGAPESVDIQFTFDYNVFNSLQEEIYTINMTAPDKITSGPYKDLHSEFREPWTRTICPSQNE